MFKNYKVENYELLNAEMINYNYDLDSPKIFYFENLYSLDEKLKIIDSLHDGIGTKLIELAQKWNIEKDELPQHMGRPKTVSANAWYKRNMGDIKYHLSYDQTFSYSLFNKSYSGPLSTLYRGDRYHSNNAYQGESIIHRWFHDMLEMMKNIEYRHFKENDKFEIKLKQLKEYAGYYGTLGSQLICDIYYNQIKDIEESKLEELIAIYENVIKLTGENIDNGYERG